MVVRLAQARALPQVRRCAQILAHAFFLRAVRAKTNSTPRILRNPQVPLQTHYPQMMGEVYPKSVGERSVRAVVAGNLPSPEEERLMEKR